VKPYTLAEETPMVDAKEKYVTDSQGNRVAVLLDVEEYQRLLDALEELESIRAYDAAVAVREDAIPFDKAIEELKRDRG
jgi:PHD/YefM family antitoxin component YafN of YafNO toxin-antitoxin module